MMNRRAWFVLGIIAWVGFGLLCWLGGPAKAADSRPAPIGESSCEDIRAAVALFPSHDAAIRAARAAGATDQQIEQAKRCLTKSGS